MKTVEQIFAEAHEPSDVFVSLLKEHAGCEHVERFIDVGSGRNGVVGLHHWNQLATKRFALDAYGIRPMPPEWDLYVPFDMRDMYQFFGPRSYDVVQCCDVIEHLTREDGEKWLLQMTQLARKAIFLFCPRGYFPNEAGHELEPDNIFQTHLSGWTEEDFQKLGYQAHPWPPAGQPVKEPGYIISWYIVARG